MNQTVLLFDADSRFLGEINTRDGAFVNSILSQTGEQTLDAHLTEWQTQGVPVLNAIISETDTGETTSTYRQRIQIRDEYFLQALYDWCSVHGLRTIPVNELGLTAWEKIGTLPLEPEERYRMIFSLCELPPAELSSGIEMLEKVRRDLEAQGALS